MTLVAMSFHVALFQTQTILRVTAVTFFQIDTSMSTQLVSRHQYQVPLPPVVLKTDTERNPPAPPKNDRLFLKRLEYPNIVLFLKIATTTKYFFHF